MKITNVVLLVCVAFSVLTPLVFADEQATAKANSTAADTPSGAKVGSASSSEAKSITGSASDAGSAPGFHRRFNHANHWVKVFDDPARDVWQKREQVIASLKLHSNDKIADIGAGTGYFAVPLAKKVAQGKVYAVDTEDDMVKYLHKLAKQEGLKNLIPIEAESSDPKLPEKVNLALVVDTFHHIDSRVAYFKNLKSSLANDARLAIVDFTHESKIGPPVEHRLSKEEVTKELKAAGYSLEEELNFLPNQYYLIYRVAPSQ